MYRKLTVVPLLLFIGVAVYQVLRYLPISDGAAYAFAAEGEFNQWQLLLGGNAGFWLVPAALGLCWAAAFHPGRQYPVWQQAAKYLAVAGGILLGGFAIYALGARTGQTALVLLSQTRVSPARSLLASFLLGALPEALALSLFLAAPVYWLLRGIRVRSLQRATFEAWVEAKRLIIPGVVLLVAGALLNAWAGPVLTTWILR